MFTGFDSKKNYKKILTDRFNVYTQPLANHLLSLALLASFTIDKYATKDVLHVWCDNSLPNIIAGVLSFQ